MPPIGPSLFSRGTGVPDFEAFRDTYGESYNPICYADDGSGQTRARSTAFKEPERTLEPELDLENTAIARAAPVTNSETATDPVLLKALGEALLSRLLQEDKRFTAWTIAREKFDLPPFLRQRLRDAIAEDTKLPATSLPDAELPKFSIKDLEKLASQSLEPLDDDRDLGYRISDFLYTTLRHQAFLEEEKENIATLLYWHPIRRGTLIMGWLFGAGTFIGWIQGKRTRENFLKGSRSFNYNTDDFNPKYVNKKLLILYNDWLARKDREAADTVARLKKTLQESPTGEFLSDPQNLFYFFDKVYPAYLNKRVKELQDTAQDLKAKKIEREASLNPEALKNFPEAAQVSLKETYGKVCAKLQEQIDKIEKKDLPALQAELREVVTQAALVKSRLDLADAQDQVIAALTKARQDARDDAILLQEINLAIRNAEDEKKGLFLALQDIAREVIGRSEAQAELTALQGKGE